MFQINIRVTLNEQLQIEEYSKCFGLSVSQYVRVRTFKKQLPKHSMPSLNRDVFIELSRIGNNLNQLTKKANQNHPDVKGLQIELLNLNNTLNQIKKKFLE